MIAKFRKKKPKKSRFFQGEMMTCFNCGRKEKSDPNVESNWTVIEMDGSAQYVCPVCFGNGEVFAMNPEQKQLRVEELYNLEEEIRADLWRLGMYGADNERAQAEIRRSNADLQDVQKELRELLADSDGLPFAPG